jgi:hypothetical protein
MQKVINNLRFAYLIEVDAHALELELRGSVVPIPSPLANRFTTAVDGYQNIHATAIETVLSGDLLPESSTNLVTLSS